MQILKQNNVASTLRKKVRSITAALWLVISMCGCVCGWSQSTIVLAENDYVVLQSACAGHTDRYVCPMGDITNPVIDVITRRDAPSIVFQLQHYNLDQDRPTLSSYFWLYNPYYRRWMGEPLSNTARVGFVTEEFKNAQGKSKWGWAGVFDITQTNGAFQFQDKNPSNNKGNEVLALKGDNTLIVGSSSASAALSQWYVHVVTPYTLTITPTEAGGSITYSGSNLYGADQEALTSGTCYFEGAPDDAGFAMAPSAHYILDAVAVDDDNHTIAITCTAKCATPSITRNGNDFSFGCSFPTSGVTIKYTTDGSDPVNGTVYSGTAVHVDDNATLKVVAVATGCYNSDVVELFVAPSATGAGSEADPYVIEYLSQLYEVDAALGAHYLLGADLDATNFRGVTGDFTGTFDGGFHTITGLSHALFCKVAGGTVKNVTVDNVVINSGVNVGALANEATGYARIYNCQVLATGCRSDIADPANEDKAFTSSSTLRGSGAVGGIVGKISGNVRVVNCVSYADVNGGTYGAGIVGQYEGSWITNTGTNVSDDGIMVMNCLMLGNVKSGSTQMSPIVGGNAITTGISTYSYFRYPSMADITTLTQNGALCVDEDIWLKRFEFFRAALNTHRDLAAVYCFGDASKKSEMAKWTIDESKSPWPVLKRHDQNTMKTLGRMIPTTTEDYAGRRLTEMGSDGYLAVSVSINGSNYSANLPITDMDTLHYDYTWGKVILPFANEFGTANGFAADWTRDYDYVCIGWKITYLKGGTTGTLTDYDFADRNCTAKDLYHATNNPFIYAQGGMFIVPYGVTGITIEAHFAKAYYLADEYYDMDISGISIGPPKDYQHTGTASGNGGLRNTTYHGKRVYNSIADAWTAMASNGDKYTPHHQAIVLVGNYHYCSNVSGTYDKRGCTLMSVDEDNDQEPDYSWQFSLVGKDAYEKTWPSMRWDFVPMLGSGVFQMCGAYIAGIVLPRTKGWWEMTETSLVRTYEYEIYDTQRSNNDNGKGNNAWILNGGYHQALVRCKSNNNNTKLSYIKLGGNVYIKDLHPGNHSAGTGNWTVRPIIITGGEIKNCFMTGVKAGNQIISNNTNQPNNIRFYCAGGKLHKYLSCYMERPVVDATIRIDHAIIYQFFGGGTSPVSPIGGDIDIQIDHSLVNLFCGGPEYGDMAEDKTVSVKAKGTTFGEYFGAGYGGTALTLIKHAEYSDNDLSNPRNPSSVYGYDNNGLGYDEANGGTCVDFEYEMLMNARGQVCERCFLHRASLSLATTHDVTSELEDCMVLGSYYGGACRGKVAGEIRSTLTNCEVRGSVFGGGYKADIPSISVMDKNRMTDDAYSRFNPTFGFFTPITYPSSTEYNWIAGDVNGTVNSTDHTITTTTSMTEMGEVSGKITLTLDGGSVGGSVFGGGNESLAKDETEVSVKGSVEHPLKIDGSVFGGGNNAAVKKDTKVTVSGTITIDNNVYGGGNGGEVEGDTQVTIGEE